MRGWRVMRGVGGSAALFAAGFLIGSTVSGLTRPAQASVGAGWVAEDDLPSAEAVFKRYVEVTGGEAAYRKVRNRVTKATVRVPEMQMNLELRTVSDDQGRTLVEVSLPGMGQQVSGVSGDIGWEYSPMSGPRLLEGAELKLMQRQGDLLAVLHPEKQYAKMTNTGVETHDNQKAYRLELVTHEGQTEIAWFSVETGLMIGTEATVATQMGEIASRSRMLDYREVDGLKIPFRMEQSMMNMTQVIEVTSVEHNTKLDDTTFVPPEAVQRLIDRRRGGN